MSVSNENALGKLLGEIYTQVFQKKPLNPNKPLNRSSHLSYDQIVSDEFRNTLDDSANIFIWGPGGFSDEVDETPLSVRWGFTGVWG